MDKKILFLGGSIYFKDAAEYAKECGYYLIVTDMNDSKKAVAKQIADETYSISTIDFESLLQLCKDKKVDGIYAGASEVNIPIAIRLCEELGLPYYANMSQWKMSTNKDIFKQKCIESGIKVAKVYSLEDIDVENKIHYPVVTKPVDNNGSTGISICSNKEELKKGYEKAVSNSKTQKVLIEEYIPSDSVIIHYTAQNGCIKFTGLSDKKSRKINNDAAPVMAIQFIPSKYEDKYLENVNEKAISMLEKEGISYGAVWIEAFYHEGEFIFNEIGFRYGGSLTYYPIEYFYGINQMHLLINHSVGNKDLYEDFENVKMKNIGKLYSILPFQIMPCKIKEIVGLDKLMEIEGIYRFVQSHTVGDEIFSTGTTSQVFGYLHVIGDSEEEINSIIAKAKDTLKVYNELNENMLFNIWKG